MLNELFWCQKKGAMTKSAVQVSSVKAFTKKSDWTHFASQECAGFQKKLSDFITSKTDLWELNNDSIFAYIIGVGVSGNECLMLYTIFTNPHTLHHLKSVLTEAEAQGCRYLLKGIWVTDTSNLSEHIQFFEDQYL